MAWAALALDGIQGGIQAAGAIEQGQAAKASADYNAAVSRQNSANAQQNSQIASQAGIAQEGMQEQKTRSVVGQTIANEAGSGVQTTSGSSADTQASEKELGMLDAINVRGNATKEAFGYKVAAVNDEAQSTLDTFQGKNAQTSGYLNAASSLVGAASQGSSDYQRYKLAGSLDGGA